MTLSGPVRSPLRFEWMAHLGGMAVITGVQLISPALPALADRFALTESEVSLVISVYMLPATLASVPAGLLADRFGRRWIFGGGLCLFGLAGLLMPMVASASFGGLLTVRFLQGLGFAPAFPLTITILGDLYTGPKLVSAQGRRSVLMSLADGGYPILGGVLVGLSWLAPWYLQAVALPIGILVLISFRDWVPRGRSGRLEGLRWLGRSVRLKGTRSLHYVGFLRFFVKFSLLSYLPLLLVISRGMTAAQAGLILGTAALCGAMGAVISGFLVRIGAGSRWVTLGIVVQGAALGAMAAVDQMWILMVVAFGYGLADGVLGTFINSYVAAATDPEHRASLVASNGAIKNLGKLLGPIVVGLAALAMPLWAALTVVAILTALSAPSAGPLRVYDAQLSQRLSTRKGPAIK